MAANYYGAQQTKMADYGYGDDDPYSFGGYSATQPPMSSGDRPVDNETQRKRSPTTDNIGTGGGMAGGIAGGIGAGVGGLMSLGRQQFERRFTDVSYDLLISKTFYFFFYAAFGSLFPLIGVYFKQLGMNPAETGMLMGFRPFIELVAVPFWGNVAERWRRWKTVLLFSLFCWVAFTLSLAFIQPDAHSCLVGNKSYVMLAEVNSVGENYYREWRGASRKKRAAIAPEVGDIALQTGRRRRRAAQLVPATRIRRADHEDQLNVHVRYRQGDAGDDYDYDYDEEYENAQQQQQQQQQNVWKIGHTFEMLPHPSFDEYGMSPLPLDHMKIENLNREQSLGLVSPPHSAVVYRLHDIHTVFLALLLIQVVGEFLSTPAITMADAATLGYLDDDVASYGRQRMYGSFGWAIAMFFVGIALDYSNVFPNHPCGTIHVVDRNYMTCYAVFAVLMCCAFITATQFRFKEMDSSIQNIQLGELKNRVMDTVQQKLTGRPANPGDGPASDGMVDGDQRQVHIGLGGGDAQSRDMVTDVAGPASTGAAPAATEPSPYVPRGVPGQAGNMPQWITVMRLFAPLRYSSMLFVLWFMGFGIGLVFSFLFWHLQDIGGTPTLFGFASVVNHLSELLAFFYIQRVVSKIGLINVVYAGIVANVVRFVCISALPGPWWILPLECIQGLTHASVWAAGCSFMTQAVPPDNGPTAQMILHSLHHAFGRGCGALIGGAIINKYGTQNTFLAYGVTCIFVFAGYFALNFFYVSKLPPPPLSTDAAAGQTESVYLAPHGVPGGIPRSPSKAKGFGGDAQYYGSSGPSSTNGYLDAGTGQYAQPDNSYNPNVYRAGGGIPRDSEYGYSRDFRCPPVGHFQLNAPAGKTASRQADDVTDLALLRRKFRAFDEATQDVADVNSKLRSGTQRVLLDSAPRPLTETVTTQPLNRDRLVFEERSPDGWLY